MQHSKLTLSREKKIDSTRGKKEKLKTVTHNTLNNSGFFDVIGGGSSGHKEEFFS